MSQYGYKVLTPPYKGKWYYIGTTNLLIDKVTEGDPTIAVSGFSKRGVYHTFTVQPKYVLDVSNFQSEKTTRRNYKTMIKYIFRKK